MSLTECPGDRCAARIDRDQLPGAMCHRCFAELDPRMRKRLEAKHRAKHGDTARHSIPKPQGASKMTGSKTVAAPSPSPARNSAGRGNRPTKRATR